MQTRACPSVGGATRHAGQGIATTRAFAPSRAAHASVAPKRRSPTALSAAFQCPYDTLGVAHDATEAEVKKAYRRAALKCHPDVSKQEGAEVRFLQLNEAYNFILGKLYGKEGSMAGMQSSDWEFHDWYWSFRMSRTWGKNQTASPRAEPRPKSRANLREQMAGLRHRAAVRANKPAADDQPQASAAAPTPDCAASTSAASHDAFDYEDAWLDPIIAMGDSMDVDMEVPDASWAYSQTRRKFVAHSGTREKVTSQLAGLRRKSSMSAGFA